MQPYQKSGNLMREKSDQAMNVLKKTGKLGLNVATTYAGGMGLAEAMKLISGNFPAETVINGLKKLFPKVGEFIDKGLKHGENFNDIKTFLSEKFTTAEESAPKSISQTVLADTDISSFPESRQKKIKFLSMITDQMEAKGMDKNDPKMKSALKKLKSVLSGKLSLGEEEELRFAQEYPQNPDTEAQQPQQQGGMVGQEMQGQQPGQGQQALMAILQKIQASRGLGG